MPLLIGSTQVATAGTAVRISTSTRKVKRAIFRSNQGNTGSVAVGDVDVSMTNGYTIEKTNTTPPLVIDMADATEKISYFYVDAANNADYVDWVFVVE